MVHKLKIQIKYEWYPNDIESLEILKLMWTTLLEQISHVLCNLCCATCAVLVPLGQMASWTRASSGVITWASSTPAEPTSLRSARPGPWQPGRRHRWRGGARHVGVRRFGGRKARGFPRALLRSRALQREPSAERHCPRNLFISFGCRLRMFALRFWLGVSTRQPLRDGLERLWKRIKSKEWRSMIRRWGDTNRIKIWEKECGDSVENVQRKSLRRDFEFAQVPPGLGIVEAL